ncbi:ankyrin repeat-containing domain protein [Colletotrichum phormii]|uniref:Ankyrin repeat-containing domain protein n=1 Tax=Colletotrichum phormii TaxID=359342 RepID=A0AAI9ZJ66_9PEZI|nr:ankyrin repeat-containing domain protein [Colletotrichum phormii]KAK1625580.1 ankyrin repeat-containing domain protein [Colletotrichum phormii]
MGTIQHKCFELAFEAGVRVEDRDEAVSGAMTPLQWASGLGYLEEARLLLEYGVDVNGPPGEEYGRTALQAAACSRHLGRLRMVQMLISRGADIAAMPARKGGLTALQGAAMRGDISLANLLVGRGADVNAPCAAEEGRTVVEGAAEYGHLHMIQLLLGAGARGYSTEGFSNAIQLAEDGGKSEVATFLRDHDALSAFIVRDLDEFAADSVVYFRLPSPGFVTVEEVSGDSNSQS